MCDCKTEIMQNFIHEDFILTNNVARELYHSFAKEMPIIDFHNHLSPKEIARNLRYDNLSQIWLGGDHYKWRAMRYNGVSEQYCSGNASDFDKFQMWSKTVPNTVGNPLYHWTHLELARYFGIYDLLAPKTAKQIFEQTAEILKSEEMSTVNLLKKMNVEMLGTTDDPADNLEYHKQLNKTPCNFKVLPSFRADKLFSVFDSEAFKEYILLLGEAADVEITNLQTLLQALDVRHDYFHQHGSRLSDSGPSRFYYEEYSEQEVNIVFQKLLAGKTIDELEYEKYMTCVMSELAILNHKRGWVQQYHVGALRNNSTRKFQSLGVDTGFDSIGAIQDPVKMSQFLNHLDKQDKLCKTILYNLNPADNEMMIAMCGNFNDGSVAAKVQYGAAWWFLDQKHGMEKHLNDISSFSQLRHFVGMVTDSRSFMSFPRHEYFRRIVCNYIGQEVEKGCIPNDQEILKNLVEGISYKNAKNYFNF